MTKLMLLIGAVAGAGVGYTYWPEGEPERIPAPVVAPFAAPLAAQLPEEPPVGPPQAQLPATMTCTIFVAGEAPGSFTLYPAGTAWQVAYYQGFGKVGYNACKCVAMVGPNGTGSIRVMVGLPEFTATALSANFGSVAVQVN
jgi:hypothetical protein